MKTTTSHDEVSVLDIVMASWNSNSNRYLIHFNNSGYRNINIIENMLRIKTFRFLYFSFWFLFFDFSSTFTFSLTSAQSLLHPESVLNNKSWVVWWEFNLREIAFARFY